MHYCIEIYFLCLLDFVEKMTNKISVCIIAKNEEKYIEECLKSVLDIADEIIVLDTGSTDKTKDIVSAFPKTKLYETTWEDDFSKARNQCISHATGDWILSIDADERLSLSSQQQLINFLDNPG